MPGDQRETARSADGGLDETNLRLLAELQDHARLSLAELGRRVGLSSPAVAERLQRLESEGCIKAYRTDIDPQALGYSLGAVIRVRPAARQLQRVADIARTSPEVVECHRITGEDCFLMRLEVRSVAELEDVIDRFAFHGQTTTSIMQRSPVPRRPAPLPTIEG